MFSETRYALNGDLRVAYRASREGPRDIVYVPNWFTCCDLGIKQPRAEMLSEESPLTLQVGIPVEQLRTPVRTVLTGRSMFQEVVLEATNRRGQAIQCRVTCTPLVGAERDTQGVILLMEEWSGHA